MLKPEGYDECIAIMPGTSLGLKPGGYICKIVKAEEKKSKNNKDKLVLYFDIAEGENAGFYQKIYDNDNSSKREWRGQYHKGKTGNALPYFKGVIRTIELSNPGYVCDWKEANLIGKLFGGVFGEEEYRKADGTIGRRVQIIDVATVDSIRNNNFVIPEVKKIAQGNTDAFSAFGGTEIQDMPF